MHTKAPFGTKRQVGGSPFGAMKDVTLAVLDVPVATTSLMSYRTGRQLRAVAAETSLGERLTLDRALRQAALEARAVAGHWDFDAPADAVDEWLKTAFPQHGVTEMLRVRRAAVARLALDHFAPEDELPPSVTELYPDFVGRLAQFLSTEARQEYDLEFFSKDVRYALGLTVPCGAMQVDLSYSIGPKLLLRDIPHSHSLRNAWVYSRCLGWGRWYNDHIDTRDLSEFSPEGWTKLFLCIADLLTCNSDVRGVTGVGWIYDPKVSEISPHLAYTRRTQVENGAFLVRVGPGPEHTRNAIHKSQTRRRLYEEGKYLPVCYLIAWPRDALIAWSRKVKGGTAPGFA